MKHLNRLFILSTGQSWAVCIVLFCLASYKASDTEARENVQERIGKLNLPIVFSS